MNSLITSIFLSLSMIFAQNAQKEREQKQAMVSFLTEYLQVKYPEETFSEFAYVAIKKQRLYLVKDHRVFKEFVISTSAKGLGSAYGSNKTPVGLHTVRDMVGEEVPLYGIIKSKVYTGELATVETRPVVTHLDLITSRVIHLSGLEEGVNSGGSTDSYSRGIFIHGTHEEGLLGKPASKGCIRMGNQDVIELYAQMHPGMHVVILNN